MNGRDCNNPDWKFDFGKYKGLTVFEVLKTDPDYLVWCEEEGIMFFHEDCDPKQSFDEFHEMYTNSVNYMPNASVAVH